MLLPWIYYPRLDKIIYGYNGDGILISILFGFMFVINIYSKLRSGGKSKKRYNIVTAIISFVILALSIYKIYAFYEDVNNFVSNDPLVGYGGAGVRLQNGLYAIAGLSFICCLLSTLSGYIKELKHLILFVVLSLFVGFSSYYIYQNKDSHNKLDKIEIEENLNKHFVAMGDALKSRRTDLFVDYIHPILYQSIGGKRKMAELMTEAYKELVIKDTKIEKIYKTETKGDVIQVLLLQNITFMKGVQEVNNTNKSVAISYDGGATWVFAGVEERSFEEMQKVLPELFSELKW